jgi:hypothetical protein
MPSSAATVSGVVCERSRLAESCVFASSLLACGWPPMPTPTIGWFWKTTHVTRASRVRPLVALRAESLTAVAATNAAPAITQAAAPTTSTRRSLGPPSTYETATPTANSAAKLDCEYANRRPAQRKAISAAPIQKRTRPSQSATRRTPIAITTLRPKTLGSLKSDVTRK